MFAAWRLARLLAVKLVEKELTERAQRPTEWPNCEKCGKKLESKGFGDRQLTGLIETVRWERARDAVRIGERSIKWPLWTGSLVCGPTSGPVLG
jgi:hypothetical protein